MFEPVSRQALEETVEPGRFTLPPQILLDAARAILDAPPLQWCVTHLAELSYEPGECWSVHLTGDRDPCQFETYVRVKVSDVEG